MIEVGQNVGNYRVLERIARGSMGDVYLAEHPVIGRKVALKVIHPQHARKVDVVARFVNEASAISRIGHEHIVGIMDFGRTPESDFYFIMEYLEGRSLADVIVAEAPLPPARALELAAQIADALAASHAHDVVHRDLRPENVFLVKRRRELDFAEQERTREADTALERELLLPRLLFAAYRIARRADERQKPDAARDPGYQERNVPKLRDELKSLAASYNPRLDRAFLKLAVQRDRARAPNHRTPALELIAGKNPTDAAIDAAIAKLYGGSKLGEEKVRLELFDGAKPATLARHADPIVRLMTKLYPHLRAVEDRRKRFEGKLLLLKPRYLEALLAFRGGAVAPDANGTLRVAYGTVKKAPRGEPGDDIGAFTSLSSMVAKSTGSAPFDTPPELLAAAPKGPRSRFVEKSLGDVPVNFLSDLQITNGNSGSATLNAKGELVGLAFDGTYQSVASDWVFSRTTRTIHVDLRYVLFLLREVEHADSLLDELGAAP